jgi:hypothetical protein
MTRRPTWLERGMAGEDGIAMVTAVLMISIMAILAAIMVANLSSELNGVGRQRNVTTAREAADAGIDQLVFLLQQCQGVNCSIQNWNQYVTSYSTLSGNWWPGGGAWNPAGKGRYRAHIDCLDPQCATSPNDRLLTVEGQYPTANNTIKTLQATVRRTTLAGLSFAMLADKGIDIHHHGSSYVTPTMVSTRVHSNGYLKIDWNSAYHVDQLEAAGAIDLAASGGTIPSGGVPAGGYTWPYWIPGSDASNSQRCYPPKIFPAKTISNADASFGTYWDVPNGSHVCPASAKKYSPNAQIMGNILANSITIENHGDSVAASSGTTCNGTTQPGFNDTITGGCIPDRPGDIDAGKVLFKLNGKTWTGPSTGNSITTHWKAGTTPPPCSLGTFCVNDCALCNQGTADTPGNAGGVVNIHPSTWSPGHVTYPSLDYRNVTYPVAQSQQPGGTAACTTGAPTCHIFPTTDNKTFLQFIGTSTNRTSYTGGNVNCTTCMFWLKADKTNASQANQVAYVLLRGTYEIKSGALLLKWSDMRTLFATPATAPTPVILVQGALVDETGSITLNSSLTVVGPGMDPFNPLEPNCSVIPLPNPCLPVTTQPGMLAGGAGITATDYDSDSKWDNTTLYEGLKRNATFVRGLAYSGLWNATSKTSTPTD